MCECTKKTRTAPNALIVNRCAGAQYSAVKSSGFTSARWREKSARGEEPGQGENAVIKAANSPLRADVYVRMDLVAKSIASASANGATGGTVCHGMGKSSISMGFENRTTCCMPPYLLLLPLQSAGTTERFQPSSRYVSR